MEQHVLDMITNGLDLISFLLVTPEVLRVIAPTAGRVVNFLVPRLVMFLALMPLVLPILFCIYWFKWDLPFFLIVVISAVAVLIATALMDFVGKGIEIWLTKRLPQHLLAAGVVLFFISRLIAFCDAGALWKASLQ